VRILRRSPAPGLLLDADAELAVTDPTAKSTAYIAGLLALLPALSLLVGFAIAAPIYVFFFLHKLGRKSILFSLGLSLGLLTFLWCVGYAFQTPFAPGYLQEFVPLPAPFD